MVIAEVRPTTSHGTRARHTVAPLFHSVHSNWLSSALEFSVQLIWFRSKQGRCSSGLVSACANIFFAKLKAELMSWNGGTSVSIASNRSDRFDFAIFECKLSDKEHFIGNPSAPFSHTMPPSPQPALNHTSLHLRSAYRILRNNIYWNLRAYQ